MSDEKMKVPGTIRITPHEAFLVSFPGGAKIMKVGSRWNGMVELVLEQGDTAQRMVVDEPVASLVTLKAFGLEPYELEVNVIKASPDIFALMLGMPETKS